MKAEFDGIRIKKLNKERKRYWLIGTTPQYRQGHDLSHTRAKLTRDRGEGRFAIHWFINWKGTDNLYLNRQAVTEFLDQFTTHRLLRREHEILHDITAHA